MKEDLQPLTKDLIRKHFGRDAKIWGFCDHYRVKTYQGYEFAISPGEIKTLYGGSKAYRQMLLFARDRWGTIKANGGSSEFKHAVAAHAEFLNIDCEPNYHSAGEAFARWFWALCIFFGGEYACLCGDLSSTWPGVLIVPVIAFIAFWLMKWSARDKAQRQLEEDGFQFPRGDVGPDSDYVDDRDLRKGGLL